VGWAAVALNLLSAPAFLGGTDPDAFYTATGVASVGMGLLPFVVWVLVTSNCDAYAAH
jgi:hypothetical protein